MSVEGRSCDRQKLAEITKKSAKQGRLSSGQNLLAGLGTMDSRKLASSHAKIKNRKGRLSFSHEGSGRKSVVDGPPTHPRRSRKRRRRRRRRITAGGPVRLVSQCTRGGGRGKLVDDRSQDQPSWKAKMKSVESERRRRSEMMKEGRRGESLRGGKEDYL